MQKARDCNMSMTQESSSWILSNEKGNNKAGNYYLNRSADEERQIEMSTTIN